jgi:hypothetical protein
MRAVTLLYVDGVANLRFWLFLWSIWVLVDAFVLTLEGVVGSQYRISLYSGGGWFGSPPPKSRLNF